MSRSIWTPGPNFTVAFGPPLKYLDSAKKHARIALVDQFANFLERLCESVNLR